MAAHVAWYADQYIILYTVSDPLTLTDLEQASEEVWALAGQVHEPLDMIFDYRQVKHFPRGGMPVVRDGHFSLPMLDRVALVGTEPLVEMMVTTLTRNTFRPDPTLHTSIEEAAEFLRRMAREDTNRS
ncbi:MAG TPA: hypothetical protein VMT34_17745 [Aggregatilineales bacterium]|nr:hypothetical protein [Aggregatilineales bacterium]